MNKEEYIKELEEDVREAEKDLKEAEKELADAIVWRDKRKVHLAEAIIQLHNEKLQWTKTNPLSKLLTNTKTVWN